MNFLFFIFWTVSVGFANVPYPTENSHPGSTEVLANFTRTQVGTLSRTSWLYLPEHSAQNKVPLIVFGHGQALDEPMYQKTLEHIAGKGLAALFVKYDNGFFDQDWGRMACDFNEITKAVLQEHGDQIDSDKLIYSGHSKGAYVAQMAAGAPNCSIPVSSLVLFAPADVNKSHLDNLSEKTPVTLVWGEEDSIISKSLIEDIYSSLNVEKKQWIEVKSYSGFSADHYFVQTKKSLFGGPQGVTPLHYYGVWKWLVAAGWDVRDGGLAVQPYLYGEEVTSTGVEGVEHQLTRNFSVRQDYLIKTKEELDGKHRFLQNFGFVPSFRKKLYKAWLTQEQVQQLGRSELVELIGKNHRFKPLSVPNDLDFRQWAYNEESQSHVQASKAWDISTGSQDIRIAVIDSGLSLRHSDLKDNLWINEKEKNGKPQVDDDGNGYVDDIHGFNFASGMADSNDSRGHGSMVAGVIAARGNNGTGITGMTWSASLMSLNIFPNLWGEATLESAVEAIQYAVDNDAQIINASWGQADDDLEPDPGFQILTDVIGEAQKKGIIFVAAAGNSHGDNDKKGMIPATLGVSNILSVGAMNSQGESWSKSNYGLNSVHVFAPGESILTTHLSGTRITSGTSLSAPMVSGLIALMLDVNPRLKAEEIVVILEESCQKSPALEYSSRCGGFIDAALAVEKARALFVN